MRHKCKEKGIPFQDFDTFLLLINDIYNQRECRRVSIATAKHDEIIRSLKRKVQHTEPYQQTLSDDKIRFLKKKLKDGQKKWGPQFAECCDILQSVLYKVSSMEGQFERYEE